MPDKIAQFASSSWADCGLTTNTERLNAASQKILSRLEDPLRKLYLLFLLENLPYFTKFKLNFQVNYQWVPEDESTPYSCKVTMYIVTSGPNCRMSIFPEEFTMILLILELNSSSHYNLHFSSLTAVHETGFWQSQGQTVACGSCDTFPLRYDVTTHCWHEAR